MPLLPGLVLHVTENLRGPFGLGPLWLAVAASLVVLFVVVRRPFSFLNFPFSIRSAAFALLVGGGLANLGERLLFGRTTDLLVVANRTALNVADLVILIGLLWLLARR